MTSRVNLTARSGHPARPDSSADGHAPPGSSPDAGDRPAPASRRRAPDSGSGPDSGSVPNVGGHGPDVDTMVVEGGTPLAGEVPLRGAKNLVPKAMVAALLGEEVSTLRNVPAIRDVEIVRNLLGLHGVEVRDAPGGDPTALELDPARVEWAAATDIEVHAGSSRVPILLCGPLLHRLGRAFIPDLGGCAIGGRPINFHLDALRQFGAEVEKGAEGLHLRAPNGLHGTRIELPYPSVGGTEQVLLTAVRAKGVTELRNAAVEPEIIDLICVLQKMGAIITMDTDRVLHITGVDRLGGFDHEAIADRIEAGSWACAALATGGEVFVRNVQQVDMMTFLNVYRRVGGEFQIRRDGIRFWHPGSKLNALALETDVHPGFMTDWQQPLVVALTQATGLSIMHETVYENRLGYTGALVDLGAHIQVYNECLGATPCRFGRQNYSHSAVVSGPSTLRGAELQIPDLRGGFSYIIAALAAQGTSTLRGIGIFERGYENFFGKLAALGADVSTY